MTSNYEILETMSRARAAHVLRTYYAANFVTCWHNWNCSLILKKSGVIPIYALNDELLNT